MEMLRTSRTYASRKNAIKALENAASKIGVEMENVYWVIAVNEEGRFAPIVLVHGNEEALYFAHAGVTVCN